MKNLLNPRWLLVFNTLPIAILFYIFYQEYSVIQMLLEEENIRYWLIFGLTLAGLAVVNLVYALFLIYKKKEVSGFYTGFCLLTYIVWIYLYLFNADNIIPFQVPQWMFSGNIFIYAGTFLMPMLAYSVLSLVAIFTRDPEERVAWINFLITIIIPVTFYLFFVVLKPWRWFDSMYISEHWYVIITIAGTLLFLFFICRSIYIIGAKKSQKWKKFELLWKIPFVIVFPVLGLLVNNGHLFTGWVSENEGVFGNFHNGWFYILAILNGVLVCMPDLPKKAYRFVLFLLRSITFTYTCYFFVVFLPFLPFSIIAIIVAGAGFLMLTPLILFLVHTNKLYTDFGYLKTYWSPAKIITTGVLAMLVIPVIISISFVRDRHILHEALEYVYEPDYTKEYAIDKNSLLKTLGTVKAQKRNRDMVLFSPYYMPYITSYYNRVVLDNLTLSESKIATLVTVFFGGQLSYSGQITKEESGYYPQVKPDERETGSASVVITDVDVSSSYNEDTQSWTSWVDAVISNVSERDVQEFITEFSMPDGCWISDYYLYVGDRKEKGLLTDKRTAMWVYSQIRDEGKDPGILHYDTGNKIVFKVFPFAENEVRKTGIEFIHKEPFTLKLDSFVLSLGNSEQAGMVQENVIELDEGNILYIPASVKKNLGKVTRRPYFHFIADASVRTEEKRERFVALADSLLSVHPLLAEGARITLTDTYTSTYAVADEWKQVYLDNSSDGGFFLDRAIKPVLASGNGSDSYPVIVVLTDDIRFSVMDKNYAGFRFLYPESGYMYVTDDCGNVTPHSLTRRTYYPAPDSLQVFPSAADVLVYTSAKGEKSYLRDEPAPDIVVKDMVNHTRFPKAKEKSWETGLWLQAYQMSQQLYPETSRKGWLNLARMSFSSGIMTPVTSYIVVENEAQRAAMERKHKGVMAGEHLLDLSDNDAQGMSEPGFYITLLLLVLFLWVMRKKTVF